MLVCWFACAGTDDDTSTDEKGKSKQSHKGDAGGRGGESKDEQTRKAGAGEETIEITDDATELFPHVAHTHTQQARNKQLYTYTQTHTDCSHLFPPLFRLRLPRRICVHILVYDMSWTTVLV
jgi:hypothetical protein